MDRQALIEQCERARHACDGVSAALQALQDTRAQARTLIAEARRLPSLGPCLDAPLIGAEAPARPPIVSVELTEHQLEMEVLRMMRTLLEGFPAHMQVKIVKVLTACTMVAVAIQMEQPPVTISA